MPLAAGTALSHYRVISLLGTGGARSISPKNLHRAAANLWVQPLDGRPRKQLTSFTTGQIFDFGWSPEGKRIARGAESRDVILLHDFE